MKDCVILKHVIKILKNQDTNMVVGIICVHLFRVVSLDKSVNQKVLWSICLEME